MTPLDYRSGLEDDFDPSRVRAGGWGSWAVYLGMSWTWCIGMFLPVILVRDYGFWAWVIFAIPNVVGAAAMGWKLKERDSQAMVVAHGPAIKAFSFVTATFQIFFALWMFEEMNVPGAATAMLLFALLIFRASRRDADTLAMANVVLMASLVTFLFEGAQGFLGAPYPVPLKVGTVFDLLAIAPVSVFGFLLCPYLDATFHRARQMLPEHQARSSFTLGFGVFFFVMIIYTLLYARLFSFGTSGHARSGIIAHWVIQLGLTTGFHWYGLPREGVPLSRSKTWSRIGLTTGTAILLWLAILLTDRIDGETLYRCFIGFYGLIFPGYVWLCMIPGKGYTAPTRRQLKVLAITVIVALPMFWLGFVEKRMLWLLPGISVVLLARLLVDSRWQLKRETFSADNR